MFFQDYMDIRAAKTESGYAGSSRVHPIRPFAGFSVDEERARVEIDLRIRLVEIGERRQNTVLERQTSFDQADHTRGGAQMPDVGLDRSEGTVSRPLCVAPVDFRQG